MTNIKSGREQFIQHAKSDLSILKEPIARSILGKDYENVVKELTGEQSDTATQIETPKDTESWKRIDYCKKLVRIGYTQGQISQMSIEDAENKIKRANQIKILLTMDFTPTEISQMSDEYISQIVLLVKG